MKKYICLLLAACLLLSLAACGGTKAEETPAPEVTAEPTAEPTAEAAEWSRSGYYTDENDCFLSITWMESAEDLTWLENPEVPGWYVGFMNGEDLMEDSYGGFLAQEGNALRGQLVSIGSTEPLTVTLSEEGEDGLALAVEGGETYHLQYLDVPEATIFVTVNTEGWGNIEYAEGNEAPEIDPEYPYQSAVINLAEPAEYTITAWPKAGNLFVKWTKNGEDFSTEPTITLLLDESADFVAVFEEDPDWQNPVMNFIGEYQSDRAHAVVECLGSDEAWITITWGGSVSEEARWDILGPLDTETLTITYSGVPKYIVTYDESGEVVSQVPEYEDGSGTVTFREDGTFVWHEDQSQTGEDMVFEWQSMPEWDMSMANPWREITEDEAAELCPETFVLPEGAENAYWNVMEEEGEAPLVEVIFELDGLTFTAREQRVSDPEADISGMWYEWTDRREDTLSGWDDLPCRVSRWLGEGEAADLCAWYDGETGVSYTLSVYGEDLDGFDILAVADAMRG